MTILVPGTLADVRARVDAAVANVGWILDCVDESPLKLAPGSLQAPPERCGWLQLDERGGRVAVSVWLPDEGPAAPREALESAFESLASRADMPLDRALLRRLKRIEGQIRGLQRMIGETRDCEQVLTQFSAVNAALKQTAARLISEHLVECVRQEIASGGDPSIINQRLLGVLFQ
ncbi:MAG: metal-sensitive transcriptional regulator [Fimbriimonadaceae bacterium]|nr:metal-sensitive transcriptional regulator [Fimbriimonadaceae bacterium]